MYSLIRDENNIFHVTLKKKCKKRKHSYSFEDSDGNFISGRLECSNDDIESLRSIQKNLTSKVPKVEVTQTLPSPSHKKKLKNIIILENTKLQNTKKIHIIENSLKHSIKNSDGKNLFHDSPRLITSTPNTSGTLTSSLKLNTTHTSSTAINLSLMESESISQINGIDSVLAKNDSQIILVNESEQLSTSLDPYLNDGGNLSFEQSLTNLNNDNFIGIVEKYNLTDQNNFDRIFLNSQVLDLSETELELLKTIDSEISIDVCLENVEKIEEVSTEMDFSKKQVMKTNDEQLILNKEASENLMPTEVDKEVNDSDPSYAPDNDSNVSIDENLYENNEPGETTSKKNDVTIVIRENIISQGFDVSLPIRHVPSSSKVSELEHNPSDGGLNEERSVGQIFNDKNGTNDTEKNAGRNSEDVDKSSKISEIPEQLENTDKKILVKPSNSGSKVHACLYCMKLQTRLPRHLELIHPLEKDVRAFLAYPRKSSIRHELIATIRNNGDYIYNSNLEGESLRNRIVSRRPNVSNPKDPSEFMFCPSCQVSVREKTLSAHFKYCTGQNGKKRRVIKKLAKIYDNDLHPEACKKLRNLIVCMHVDDVSKTLKFDTLLIRFGNTLCEKYKQDQQNELIRNRLRLLSKLLVTTQKIEKHTFEKNNLGKSFIFTPKIKNMTCLFHPQHINTCIKAVHLMAGGNDKNYDMKSPSVASLIGTLLKQLGNFLKCENIMSNLKNKNEEIDDFLLVVERKWADVINKNVQEAQIKKKRQKKIILPTTDDINKLMDHLLNQQMLAYNSLKEQFSTENYLLLAETTLMIVQMFNRRRAGEMERVLWEDFKLYNSLKQDRFKEIMESISAQAREFCNKYVRFSIRGKRGRDVTVLLDETMFSAIEMLEKNRLKAGIRQNNPYIFGIPGNSDDKYCYLRACVLMRKYSKQCGAQNPGSLRGTTLRKHIATYLVNHNAANIDRTKLANHLGHNMGIHENYYHLVNVAEEICQLPRVLESACGAKHSKDKNHDSSDDSDSNSEDEQSEADNYELFQKNSLMANSSINAGEVSCSNSPKTLSGVSLDKDLDESIKTSCRRQKWNERHIDAMLNHFKDEIKDGRYPNNKKMMKVCSIEPLLKNRSIPAMRTWFSNYYKKIKPKKAE
ncbi:uncharacterized protein LOC130678161 [Microplitis mediator]|uniref:uncharacterized protein LOC130665415 n=1 Tax=Microplitis mediator TaxID=375433 RepID=UPI002552AF5D|nr:uncharacterized protein LOC130665415 [Microplitis mediator]XP_057341176.1 uncharacterized protein LOC130678161 [Microplitis mediator]